MLLQGLQDLRRMTFLAQSKCQEMCWRRKVSMQVLSTKNNSQRRYKSDLAHSFCGREVQDLVVFAKSLGLPHNAVMPSNLRSVSNRSKNHVSKRRRGQPPVIADPSIHSQELHPDVPNTVSTRPHVPTASQSDFSTTLRSATLVQTTAVPLCQIRVEKEQHNYIMPGGKQIPPSKGWMGVEIKDAEEAGFTELSGLCRVLGGRARKRVCDEDQGRQKRRHWTIFYCTLITCFDLYISFQ